MQLPAILMRRPFPAASDLLVFTREGEHGPAETMSGYVLSGDWQMARLRSSE